MLSRKLFTNLFKTSRRVPVRYSSAKLEPTLATHDPSETAEDLEYQESITRHRKLLPLYELYPRIGGENYIAETATLVGEVFVDSYSHVLNNVVIRGDLNSVRIDPYSTVGDNTVIQTVASLPTGQVASVDIGANVTIGSDCTISS